MKQFSPRESVIYKGPRDQKCRLPFIPISVHFPTSNRVIFHATNRHRGHLFVRLCHPWLLLVSGK